MWPFRKPKPEPDEVVAVSFAGGYQKVAVERDADGRPIAWIYDTLIRLDEPEHRDVVWLKRRAARAADSREDGNG